MREEEENINTDEMIIMIEWLLSLDLEESYVIESDSKTAKISLKFTGDQYKVCSEVLKWLTSPDRLENIRIMKRIRNSKELSNS